MPDIPYKKSNVSLYGANGYKKAPTGIKKMEDNGNLAFYKMI